MRLYVEDTLVAQFSTVCTPLQLRGYETAFLQTSIRDQRAVCPVRLLSVKIADERC